MALQDSHTAHVSLAVHTVAAVTAKTANKSSYPHARFILTRMSARGEAESDESSMNLNELRQPIRDRICGV